MTKQNLPDVGRYIFEHLNMINFDYKAADVHTRCIVWGETYNKTIMVGHAARSIYAVLMQHNIFESSSISNG